MEGGINLFTYVKNDPVNKIDPWGLKDKIPLGPDGCPLGWGKKGKECVPVQDKNSTCRPGTVWDGDAAGGGCVDPFGKWKDKDVEAYLSKKMEIPHWVCEMGVHVGCHVLCNAAAHLPPWVCYTACTAAAALACPEKCEGKKN